MGAVCVQVTQVWDVGELECHHAVKAERLKWEACEARLVAQLEALTGSGQVELREKPTSTSRSSFSTSTLKFRQPDCHPDIQKLVCARVLEPQARGARVFESEKEAL